MFFECSAYAMLMNYSQAIQGKKKKLLWIPAKVIKLLLLFNYLLLIIYIFKYLAKGDRAGKSPFCEQVLLFPFHRWRLQRGQGAG